MQRLASIMLFIVTKIFCSLHQLERIFSQSHPIPESSLFLAAILDR